MSFRIQHAEFKTSEHAQFRTQLPFARSECSRANIIDVQQLVNNDGNNEIKDVFELTLQIKVSGTNEILSKLNSE